MSACIPFDGHVAPDGYGRIDRDGRKLAAHRVAYEQANGPVPAGLTVDHTCHNRDSECEGGTSCVHRRCINPDHLEAVTRGENTLRSPNSPPGRNLRKTHCPKGHPYDDANTYVAFRGDGRSFRVCRACRRRADQLRYRARAGVAA